jgi:outer membrane protein TolC
MRHHLSPAAILVGMLSLGGTAHAQHSPAPTIGFSEVAELTLRHNPQIAAGREHVRARQGSAQSAAGAFDAQLHTYMRGDREYTPVGDTPANGGSEAGKASRISYGAGISRRFRSGLVLSQEAGVVRTEVAAHPTNAPNVATAQLSATVPLLRGRGSGGIAAAAERAASLSHTAIALRLRQTAAQAIREVGMAYWHYVAVHRQIEVYREAEQRAQTLVEETRTLVEKDERPASDLVPLRANLAYREAVRIEAEQRLIEQRLRLGLAIGLPAGEIPRLPNPADDFPVASAEALARDSLVTDLVGLAMRKRADLAAAGLDRSAAQARLRGAESEAKPRLDLALRIGYSGMESGTQFDHLFTSFYRNVAGFSSGLEVIYQWPTRNLTARGAEMQSEAQVALHAIDVENVGRTIHSTVESLVAVLRLTLQEVERSRKSLELYQAVVETEKAKFQNGMSTLFDVIQAEEGLTRARVYDIATLERHAVGLLLLRAETGTLTSPGSGDQVAIPREHLFAVPGVAGLDGSDAVRAGLPGRALEIP